MPRRQLDAAHAWQRAMSGACAAVLLSNCSTSSLKKFVQDANFEFSRLRMAHTAVGCPDMFATPLKLLDSQMPPSDISGRHIEPPVFIFEFSGFKRICAKTAAPGVEALAGLLEPRCQTEDLPARLRAAVVSYVDNGGVLSMPVLAAPVAGDEPAAECEAGDAGCDAPTPVLRHRLLEQGFRLNSKAFMLRFNYCAFTEAT